jgi:hypothetical protein
MMFRDRSITEQHPRIAAAFAFGAASVIHIMIVISFYGPPVTIIMPILYVLAHAAAGAIGGRTILDPSCTPTARSAALRGIAVMPLSLLLLWIVALAIVLPSAYLRKDAVEWFEQPDAGTAAYAIITKLGLAYIKWAWWLVPFGAIVGWYLFARSRDGIYESIGD